MCNLLPARPRNGYDMKALTSFTGRSGRQRIKVFAWHHIKKRWQSLGIWNPDWGIPGRDPSDSSAPSYWKFSLEHPNSRAVRLRQGVRRSEPAVLPPPRHSLGPDADRSAGEAFITSRPWYVHDPLELEEERTRIRRLPNHRWRLDQGEADRYVAACWRETGELAARGRPGRSWFSWKWSRESPSPEPVDMTELDLDFTPSEVDALEGIPPPTPAPPIPSGSRRPY
ncbi:hypothetical protein CDD83_5385 [Cordyceps sp. RAO-2017]|nr:hypothetical protein CDD83_5385 [Cordyceps sp. RAO-2017]